MTLSIAYILYMWVVTLASALTVSRKRTKRVYILFLILLALSCINETTAFFIKIYHYSTHFQYNLFYYIRFPLLAYIYHVLYKDIHRSAVLPVIFYGITPPLLIYCSLHFGWNHVHTAYFIAGGVFIIVNSIYFFYLAIMNEEHASPFSLPFFWITTGLFLFFLAIMPTIGLINYLVKHEMILAIQQQSFIRVMNFLLYSLILVDYLLQWKQMKSNY